MDRSFFRRSCRVRSGITRSKSQRLGDVVADANQGRGTLAKLRASLEQAPSLAAVDAAKWFVEQYEIGEACINARDQAAVVALATRNRSAAFHRFRNPSGNDCST